MTSSFSRNSIVYLFVAILVSQSTFAQPSWNASAQSADMDPALVALINSGNWAAVANFAHEKALAAKYGKMRLPPSVWTWKWIGITLTQEEIPTFSSELLKVIAEKFYSYSKNRSPDETWNQVLKVDFKGNEFAIDIDSSGKIILRNWHKRGGKISSRTDNIPCYDLAQGCACTIFHYGNGFRIKDIVEKLRGKKGIVPILHVNNDSIVFRRALNGDLASYLKANPSLTLHTKLLLIHGILNGLKSMQTILHRSAGLILPLDHADLKACNILIDTSEGGRNLAYVSDFDFSGKWEDLGISVGWTAPEVVAAFHVIEQNDLDSIAEFHRLNLNKKDIWSLGLLISLIIDHQLIELSDRFFGLCALGFIRKAASLNKAQMFVNTLMIQQNDIDADLDALIAEATKWQQNLVADLWRLVRKCLKVKPEQRATLTQVADEFDSIFARYQLVDELGPRK